MYCSMKNFVRTNILFLSNVAWKKIHIQNSNLLYFMFSRTLGVMFKVKQLFTKIYLLFCGVQTFHHLTFFHPVCHSRTFNHWTYNDVDFLSRGHFSTRHAITQTFNHCKI